MVGSTVVLRVMTYRIMRWIFFGYAMNAFSTRTYLSFIIYCFNCVFFFIHSIIFPHFAGPSCPKQSHKYIYTCATRHIMIKFKWQRVFIPTRNVLARRSDYSFYFLSRDILCFFSLLFFILFFLFAETVFMAHGHKNIGYVFIKKININFYT